MDVTSIFLPPEALQGQDIPSHVLWKGNKYTEIEIRYVAELRLSEIYNVAEGNYTNDNNTLIVRRVDSEGYLGLLFKSSKQPKSRSSAGVDYIFRSNDEVTYRNTKSVYLFRPDLALVDVPPVIHIGEGSNPDKRITLSNLGEGTAIVFVDTTSESAVKRVQPAYVREFVQNYIMDLATKLTRLKDDFPSYSDIIEELLAYENKTSLSTELSDVQNYQSLMKRLDTIAEHDHSFARKLVEAYVSSILGNIYFRTLAEVFLDYIDSIGKKRTLFADPLSVFKVPIGETSIELKIQSWDLLHAESGSLPPIKILLKANEDCEIPVYKLIRWD